MFTYLLAAIVLGGPLCIIARAIWPEPQVRKPLHMTRQDVDRTVQLAEVRRNVGRFWQQ